MHGIAYSGGGGLRLAADLHGREGDPPIVFLPGASQPRVLSYSDLLLDAARILRGMRDAGVGPGDRVLIRLADEPDLLAVFWACELGGFVPVPVAACPTRSRPVSNGGIASR